LRIEHKDELSYDALTQEDKDFMANTFSLDAIRFELTRWLHSQGIFTLALGHPQGWSWFLRRFASVVSDCPLKLTGGKFVKEVTLEIVSGNASETRLDFEWKFTRMDDTSFVWSVPTYFVKEPYAFGRDGRRSQELADAFEAKLRNQGLMVPWESSPLPR
jgi:hypothetical protein